MIDPGDVGRFFLVLGLLAGLWVLVSFGKLVEWHDRRKWDRRRRRRRRDEEYDDR